MLNSIESVALPQNILHCSTGELQLLNRVSVINASYEEEWEKLNEFKQKDKNKQFKVCNVK